MTVETLSMWFEYLSLELDYYSFVHHSLNYTITASRRQISREQCNWYETQIFPRGGKDFRLCIMSEANTTNSFCPRVPNRLLEADITESTEDLLCCHAVANRKSLRNDSKR